MTSMKEEKTDPRGVRKLTTIKKRMRQIRNEQGLDELSAMGNYPSTLKERKQILIHEGCDLNDQTFIYDFGDGNKELQREITDCFKVGLKYIPNNRNVIKSIKFLSKKIHGEERWKNLPIYWVNGHSNIELKIILKPPEDMSSEEASEEMEYDYISQLLENFEINRAPTTLTQKEPAPSDFFETKEGVFVAITAPLGYDAICGDWSQSKFLRKGHKDKFSGLRNILLSEKYDELFSHNTPNMITAFTPPHNSALNKTYRFYDDIDEKSPNYSYEKWGVLRLDKIENREFLKNHADGIQIRNTVDKLRALNEGTDGKIKHLIERSVRESFDISLKQITDILGPGIYLDATCCGLSIKLWDSVAGEDKKGKWAVFGPDSLEDFNKIQPIYDIIMEDLDLMRHQQKLSWANIVSKEEDFVPTLRERQLIDYSNFIASGTTATTASNKSRKKTEDKNEGSEDEISDNEMPARLVSVPQDLRSKYNKDGKLKNGGRKTKRKKRNKKTRKRAKTNKRKK